MQHLLFFPNLKPVKSFCNAHRVFRNLHSTMIIRSLGKRHSVSVQSAHTLSWILNQCSWLQTNMEWVLDSLFCLGKDSKVRVCRLETWVSSGDHLVLLQMAFRGDPYSTSQWPITPVLKDLMPSSDLYRYRNINMWVKHSCIENIANAANEYSPIKDVDIF